MSLRTDHASLFACNLALGETAGTVLVLGAPPEPVLMGLGACASGVTFADPEAAREARELLDARSPAWIDAADPAEVGLHQNLVVWGLPEDDGILEVALQQVVDEGRVLLSTPRTGRPDRRLERLVLAACAPTPARPRHAPEDRLVLVGERAAMTPGDTEEESPGALPIAVIVTTDGEGELLEELLCDLLLRQRFPPSEVFVMDRSGGEVPERLYGLPSLSTVRTVLVPCGPVAPGVAVNDALGGVSSPYVAVLREGCRLSANHLVCLGMVLEAETGWSSVSGERVVRASGGGLLGCLPALPPGCASSLFRMEALRQAGGFEDAGDVVVSERFWTRLAEGGFVGGLPMTVASVPEL
jgi:hypothetical protein